MPIIRLCHYHFYIRRAYHVKYGDVKRIKHDIQNAILTIGVL